MNRKITKLFVCLAFVGSTYTVSSQAFEEGTSVAAIGYGFPNLGKTLLNSGNSSSDYKVSGFGPLHARYEYGLTDRFGIGVSINYVTFGATWTEESTYYNSTTGLWEAATYTHEEKLSSWNLLVRFNRHWDVSDKVDIFSGGGVGYSNWTMKHTTNDPNYSDDSFTFPIPVGFEATLGVRFYFTDNIGAYIEAGWSKSILQAGIAAKF